MPLQSIESRGGNDLVNVFRTATKGRAEALIVVAFGAQWPQIVNLTVKNRLPAMFTDPAFVRDGGLMSYSADVIEQYRRAAIYVDKILKGAKPADLPVEQPMKFEFIINLKTAEQIGLTIPPNVLVRADRVIR
jgi:putative tryptophan/tyrosine transport system substrate-binding protein